MPGSARPSLVLLVDDNPDDRDLTLIALSEVYAGGNVVVCEDGEVALDYLFATGRYAGRDPSVVPDFILLDLKLPKVDGIEVLKRVRADPRYVTIPVIVLTSSREASDVVLSYRCGANSYIRKPVDFAQFLETMRQIVTYWLNINEPGPRHAE
jgi:two-component system, response regulator